MNKFEALETINKIWNSRELSLEERILRISTAYHSSGLDLATTAAYIKATPAELEMLLELGELDDEIISLISEVNPPITTWTMLAEASDTEIKEALRSFEDNRETRNDSMSNYTVSEYIYNKMMEVSGPTIEQKVNDLTGDDIKHVIKKGEDFDILNKWQDKFLKDIARQKKIGKTLTDKQLMKLVETLGVLIEKGAITRNSIDGDQEICDRILDAMEL